MKYDKQPIELPQQLDLLQRRGMLKYGAFWFMDTGLFKDKSIFRNCLENIQKEVSRSNEDFLKEHFTKYDTPSLPPVWKTMEVVSFGALSKLYGNFSDTEVKKEVARSFGLPQYLYLESWMKCAAVLRNYCAHHARLWNRRFPIMPHLPKKTPFGMDKHISITTDETLRPTLLFGISGTKHLSEQRLQGRNHSFALRQVPDDYKGYGFSKKLARRTLMERIK